MNRPLVPGVCFDSQSFLKKGEFDIDASRQLTTRRMLVISPDAFEVHQSEAPDNEFVSAESADRGRAQEEHARVVDLLREQLESVLVFPGRSHEDIFPNNVFATVNPSNGVEKEFLVGAMKNEARKMESERPDILGRFLEEGYSIKKVSELTNDPAELTGVMIIDHLRNIGFCGLSDRVTKTSAEVLKDLFRLYSVFAFPIDIYHTNVGLSILAGRVCVICPDMLVNKSDFEVFKQLYPQMIVLDPEQMANFAGNCLAITEEDVMMSSRAYRSLRRDQIQQFSRYGFKIHHRELTEIEKSGGSMRCLLAEVF